jgi:hypothetical protein
MEHPHCGGAWGAVMSLRIRWARALAVASGLTLLVTGLAPGMASARTPRRIVCRSTGQLCPKASGTSVAGHRVTAASSRAIPRVGQALGRTLIFGGGDRTDGGLGITPSEPITNLQNILTDAGYGVDTSSTLPSHLSQYKAIWFLDTSPLSSANQTELEAFVNAGNGLYLTGENDVCCSMLNQADTALIDALVAGGGVQAGGQGEADSPKAPNAVTSNAIDDVTLTPNVLTSWSPGGPGGLGGVVPPNVLTSTNFMGVPTPTGAVWDGSDLTSGRGRLAILMDITWLETETPWDQMTATQMVQNVERFLMSATPVPITTNAQWAGYAAKAHGSQEVSGQWTVPTVDCSQDSAPSALGIWVGIDGFGNEKLVAAGVGVTCASSTASPCYYFFTQVRPGSEQPQPSGCGALAPGDVISVDVKNAPFGSSTFVATISDNGSPVGQPINLIAPTKRDKSAECVVQLPSQSVVAPGTTTPIIYKQLAEFGTVAFTQCQAMATQNAGPTLDTDQLASGSDGTFSVRSLNMGSHVKTLATTDAPSWPATSWSVSWDRSH